MNTLLGNKISDAGHKKKSSALLQTLPKITVTFIAMSVLAGCGGGGGGDSSDSSDIGGNIVDVPANDGIPTPVAPDPVAPTPVAPDPVAPTPVAPDPITQQNSLSQLFGRTIFTYIFNNGTGAVFIYDASFGSEDLSEDMILIDTVDSFFLESPDSSFVSIGTEVMGCSDLEELEQFVCTVPLGDGSVDMFLFDRLVNNEIVGVYTFCLTGLTTEQCVDEILTTPDGTVLVSVSEQGLASSTTFTQLDAAKNTPSGSSIIPYLQYEDQGSLGSTVNSLSVDPDSSIPILNALEEIRASTKTVKLD